MTSDAHGVTPRPVTPAGILAQRLGELARSVDGRANIDAFVRAELAELAALSAGLEPYVDRHSSPESVARAQLAARTRAHDWPALDARGLGLELEMLSGHVEGQLLKMLVAATRATRVLEIGMFTGYSALAMAEALPPTGIVVACEVDPDVAAFAQRGFDACPAGSLIDVRVGPATDTLMQLSDEHEAFDLIFVDADKSSYAAYVDVILAARLLAPDGLLCIDNTLLQGQPWTGRASANGSAIARFNERLSADRRVEQVLLPVRDGLTLARWAAGYGTP